MNHNKTIGNTFITNHLHTKKEFLNISTPQNECTTNAVYIVIYPPPYMAYIIAISTYILFYKSYSSFPSLLEYVCDILFYFICVGEYYYF